MKTLIEFALNDLPPLLVGVSVGCMIVAGWMS
jgi:hypothetical protein